MRDYRFYIDATPIEIVNESELALSFDYFDEAGARTFKKKFVSFVVKGTAASYIRSIQSLGISSLCQFILFEAKELCNNIESTIYQGKFTVINCKFFDNCTIEVTVSNNDLLSCITDNWEKEYNILEQSDIQSSIVIDGSDIEYAVYQFPAPVSPSEWQSLDIFTAVSTCTFPADTIDVEIIARQKAVRYCVGGVPQPPSGAGWYLVSDDCATNGTATYARPITPSCSGVDYTFCCTAPACPDPPDPPDLINQWLYIGAIFFNVTRFYFWKNLTGCQVVLPNGRYLLDVIDFLLAKDCPTLAVRSNFFTDVNNSITGACNTTNNLILYQKSDIVAPLATEKASVGMLSLKELLNDLHNMFNVVWAIDETTSELVIEHVTDSFFTPSLYIDLTNFEFGRWAKNRNTFSYDDFEAFKREQWNFVTEPDGIDFTGTPIEYSSDCAKQGVKTYSISRLETEVTRIINNAEESLDGFVLIQPESLRQIGSCWQYGRITGQFYPNAPLGIAALLEDYWQYERPLPTGTLNFNAVTFFSLIRLIRQENIEYPICCIADFVAYCLVQTELGQGLQMESFSYSMESKTIKTTLKHEVI